MKPFLHTQAVFVALIAALSAQATTSPVNRTPAAASGVHLSPAVSTEAHKQSAPDNEAEAISRINRSDKIKLEFQQMPLADVIAALVHGSGADVRFHDRAAFAERITLSVEESRWSLLHSLAANYAFAMQWKDGGWLLTRSLPKTAASKGIYPLKYLSGDRAEQQAAQLLKVLSGTENDVVVRYDANLGAYEVTAGARSQAIARQFVRTRDTKQTKVQIEVTVIFGRSLPETEALMSAESFARLLADVRRSAEVLSASETILGPGGTRIALPHDSYCEVYVHPFGDSGHIGMRFDAEVRKTATAAGFKFEPDPRAAAANAPSKTPAKAPNVKLPAIKPGLTLTNGQTTIARSGDGTALIAVTARLVDDAD